MKMEQAATKVRFAKADGNHGVGQPPEIRPPRRDDMLVRPPVLDKPILGIKGTAGIFLSISVLSLIAISANYGLLDLLRRTLPVDDATGSVVAQIIQVESNGCTNVRNKRSTALGPGQFIEATWLRLIQKHRPDLANRSRSELLAMRQDIELSREMTARFAERNANFLRKRGHSVTPGTLYLSHFAGSAGAVAILSAPATADAALIMAAADSTGRITRDTIVNANPFLRKFTIADLKGWADLKMQRQQSYQGKQRSCTS
jgi:hypothetical protein